MGMLNRVVFPIIRRGLRHSLNVRERKILGNNCPPPISSEFYLRHDSTVSLKGIHHWFATHCNAPLVFSQWEKNRANPEHRARPLRIDFPAFACFIDKGWKGTKVTQELGSGVVISFATSGHVFRTMDRRHAVDLVSSR
jgi:hypothetical protein